MRDAILGVRARGAPVIAVSPIIGGRALKGTADRMLATLGHEVSALGVARLYADVTDVFLLDTEDAALVPAVEALGMRALVTDTIMTDDAARNRLAAEVLAAAGLGCAPWAEGPQAAFATPAAAAPEPAAARSRHQSSVVAIASSSGVRSNGPNAVSNADQSLIHGSFHWYSTTFTSRTMDTNRPGDLSSPAARPPVPLA